MVWAPQRTHFVIPLLMERNGGKKPTRGPIEDAMSGAIFNHLRVGADKKALPLLL